MAFLKKKCFTKSTFFSKSISIKKFTLKKSKTEKEKNRKIKKNNKNCIFCYKLYVKNGIFERKIILLKHFFPKKIN